MPKLSQILSALSDENRRKILDLLKKREMSVGEINGKLDITMATLSHHLDVLRRADLIGSRRDGQRIIYSIKMSLLEDAAEQIVKYLKK